MLFRTVLERALCTVFRRLRNGPGDAEILLLAWESRL